MRWNECGMMQPSPKSKTRLDRGPVKAVLAGVLAGMMLLGCASSQQGKKPGEQYPDLVTLTPPGDQHRKPSKVYIDSVRRISHHESPALLIHGTFPDGCTRLASADHEFQHDTLAITLSAWRNPDKICAQVLTPFTFIYNNISSREFGSRIPVSINGVPYNTQPERIMHN